MRSNPARLALLHELAVLDTAPEAVYDQITNLVATSLDVPIAMVSLLDENRDWFKSCVGYPASESAAETSFCEIFFDKPDDLIVVEDTRADERFLQHVFVMGAPFIRFYAAARLVVHGETVGTLCVYDTRPHVLTPAQLTDLRTLASAAVELLSRRLAVN
jgi:GAF domain-containing protein